MLTFTFSASAEIVLGALGVAASSAHSSVSGFTSAAQRAGLCRLQPIEPPCLF